MSPRAFHPVADAFPLMTGKEFDDLVEDVRTHGLREPIWLHQDGRILDGRNRYRACVEAKQEPRFQPYIGPDEELAAFVVSMNVRRRHLNESQRAMVSASLADLSIGANQHDEGVSIETASELLNVSRATTARARKVQREAAPEVVEAVQQGVLTVSDAAAVSEAPHSEQREMLEAVTTGQFDNLKVAKRRRDLERQRQEIEDGRAELPPGVFEVIALDPPWPYYTQYHPDHCRVATPYPTMSIEELEALQLPAADNCILWLWTTNAFMPDACALLPKWGFMLKNILTWVKPRFGVGRWLRNQTEHCLLATKGSPKVILTNQTTVLEAPAREHSRKPDEFYEMVETLCIGRRLDYFSREHRPGWEQFGNDPGKFGDAA